MKTKKRPRKIRRRQSMALPLIVVGVTMGVAAVIVALRPARVQSVAVQREVKVTGEHDMVLIPTPTRAIAKGERLGNINFTTIKWPKSRVTDEYLHDVSEHKDSVTLTPLPRYLPVPLSAITTDSMNMNAVVEEIPVGMRAITVKVDAESAVEGWARTGNYVDVILIRASKKGFGGLEAKVISENVRILSAGRSTQQMRGGTSAPVAPKTVTLLTTQEDALKIKAASSLGKLTFALRGQGDKAPSTITVLNQRSLLGGARRVSLKKEEHIRGYARDSVGRLYVLGENSRWIRSAEPPPGFLSIAQPKKEEDELAKKSGGKEGTASSEDSVGTSTPSQAARAKLKEEKVEKQAEEEHKR